MTDEELLKRYESDMRFRNLLPGTIAVRHRYLMKFSRDVGFSEATDQKIVDWLGERDLTPKTRAMWLSTLSAFYKWAAKNSLFDGYTDPKTGVKKDFDPVAKVAKPRLHGRQPRPMSDDDINKAIDNAEPLMKCWLLLGAYCGTRCQEIAFIEREDVLDEMGSLHITHGKGDKSRFVPLHPLVLDALKALPMLESGRLWGDESAASISRKGNRYLHSLKIKSTMHTLRHWYGTHVYRASRDLVLTQNLMGHSSPTTTAVYAAADQSKSAGVVNVLSTNPDTFRRGVEELEIQRGGGNAS